jgi:pimeloyl-ACP methyl ester carboxylesterase
MPFITAHDGTEIYYRDWGTGAPVVLIHGWPLNGDMWEHQSNFLAEHGARVINYDRRGFGWSGKPWSGYDYDTLAADLHSLLERLDVAGATLVGFSMGGGEVIRYLSRYGAHRVDRAILVSAVPPYLLKTSDNPDGVDPKVFEDIEKSIRQDRPAFLKEFGPKFFGRSALHHTVSEAVLDWTQSMALTGTLRSTLSTARAWSMTDFRAEMKSIRIPVRLIHGTGDATVPIQVSAHRSLQILPNATLSEYDGEPHGLFLTAADRLNAEILQFSGAATPDPISVPALSARL